MNNEYAIRCIYKSCFTHSGGWGLMINGGPPRPFNGIVEFTIILISISTLFRKLICHNFSCNSESLISGSPTFAKWLFGGSW